MLGGLSVATVRALGAFCVAFAICASQSALAQRTDENATAEADDAFGRSVGTESIGIYNSSDVRGFSPVDAGNVRIEGLYFDRQTDPTQRLIQGSTIRVGIAAQSYAFPSPTGIVDYELRRVGGERVISPVVTYGPWDSIGIDLDAQIPLVGERLGVAAGFGYYNDAFEWGGRNRANSLAIIPRWRPTEDIEVMPFFSRVRFYSEEAQPLLLTADGGLPPQKIRRQHFYGQPWAFHEGETRTTGVIAEARLGQWITRMGLFESVFAPSQEMADIFDEIDSNGIGREIVVAFPDSRFGSRSGELRATRTFEGETRKHSLHFTARGRSQERRYGGEVEVDMGLSQIGVGRPQPRPELEFGEQSHDEVEQGTGGVAYELQWKNRGEMSVGMQKTFYKKTGETPDGVLPESSAEPVLLNATGTFFASDVLAIYGSYTEGLEESPIAPDTAINRNVAAPALNTEQYDAGIRWTITRNLKLITGVFYIEKPYFDLDASGFFRSLGSVEHQGVEFSLAGSPLEGLSVVAGTRFLDAKVSGPLVDAGLIGEKPVGVAKSYSVASADYTIRSTGVSLDAVIENISSEPANTRNTLNTPGRTVVHLGGRYRFKLLNKPATLRAQWSNVFDRYGWVVVSGGAYVYNAPRRFTAYLAMDL
jgi:iron complex outermembrane receptor protein